MLPLEAKAIIEESIAKRVGRIVRGPHGEIIEVAGGMTDERLEAFCTLPSIRKLAFRMDYVTDTGIAHVKNLRNLESLYLSDTKVTSRGLQVIRELPNLVEFSFISNREDIDEAGQAIANCANLRKVTISSSKFSSNSIASILQLPQLEVLTFEGNSIVTDEAFRDIEPAKHLLHLVCCDTSISDRSCDWISRCVKLKTLSIGSTQVTDQGLAMLSQSGALTDLNIGRLPITDDGIAFLKHLKQLDTLFLFDCDQLTDGCVKHLLQCKNLIALDVTFTQLTNDGMRRLSESRLWRSLSGGPEERSSDT